MISTTNIFCFHHVVSFIVKWWGWGIVHEVFHVVAACFAGCGHEALKPANALAMITSRCVVIQGTSREQDTTIRHAGWIGSCAALCIVLFVYGQSLSSGASLVVALESVLSDLLGVEEAVAFPELSHAFHCGNFGIIILGKKNREYVYDILKKMVQVTMM